jgi:hypothetical protein
MSTRSIVARPDAEHGWEGRYVHSDGYPTGVGKHLFEQYHVHFEGHPDLMAAKLVDGEPIGWSALAGYDLSLPPEWDPIYEHPYDLATGTYAGVPTTTFESADGRSYEATDYASWYAAHGPQSYAARGEFGEVRLFPGVQAEEWLYTIEAKGLSVFKGDSHTGHEHRAFIPWNSEPNWDEVECGAHFEQCGHMATAHFPDAAYVTTDVWLGRAEPRLDDAVQVKIGRKVYTLGRSGSLERLPRGGYGNRWLASVIDSKGVTSDMAVMFSDHETPLPGVTFRFGPIADGSIPAPRTGE